MEDKKIEISEIWKYPDTSFLKGYKKVLGVRNWFFQNKYFLLEKLTFILKMEKLKHIGT